MKLVVILAIWILAIIGEIKCIIKAFNCDWSDKTSYKSEIIYTASACCGLGFIVGWMDIGEDYN